MLGLLKLVILAFSANFSLLKPPLLLQSVRVNQLSEALD